jgi:hypothetical protein
MPDLPNVTRETLLECDVVCRDRDDSSLSSERLRQRGRQIQHLDLRHDEAAATGDPQRPRPDWSPDGRSLVFVRGGDIRVAAIATKGHTHSSVGGTAVNASRGRGGRRTGAGSPLSGSSRSRAAGRVRLCMSREPTARTNAASARGDPAYLLRGRRTGERSHTPGRAATSRTRSSACGSTAAAGACCLARDRIAAVSACAGLGSGSLAITLPASVPKR